MRRPCIPPSGHSHGGFICIQSLLSLKRVSELERVRIIRSGLSGNYFPKEVHLNTGYFPIIGVSKYLRSELSDICNEIGIFDTIPIFTIIT